MKTDQVLIVIMFLLCSCRKEVEINLPKPENKIIINNLFSSDSVFKVRVSTLQGMFDNSPSVINNAEVKLFINTAFSQNLTSMGNGAYKSDSIRPITGTEYKIMVSIPNYPTATTSCIMPKNKILLEMTKRKDSVGVNEKGEYYSEATILFTDPIEENNYYEIRMALIDSLNSGKLYYNLSNLFGNDPVIDNENDIQYNPPFILFSDDLINGKKYNLKFNYIPTIDHYSEPANKNYKIVIQFNSISEEYYKYKKKLIRHFSAQNSSIWEPSEPAQMYSNVQGGYGIFAGYCSVTDTILK